MNKYHGAILTESGDIELEFTTVPHWDLESAEDQARNLCRTLNKASPVRLYWTISPQQGVSEG